MSQSAFSAVIFSLIGLPSSVVGLHGATGRCAPPQMMAGSALKKLALTQANAAATTIVETNTLLDPVARACVDCKPTQDALASQEKALLPAAARAKLARVRLWSAKQLIAIADKPRSDEPQAVWRFARSFLAVAGILYVATVLAFLLALMAPGAPASSPLRTTTQILRIPLLLFDVELSFA